jgi:hypothetical protein
MLQVQVVQRTAAKRPAAATPSPVPMISLAPAADELLVFAEEEVAAAAPPEAAEVSWEVPLVAEVVALVDVEVELEPPQAAAAEEGRLLTPTVAQRVLANWMVS